MVEVRLFAYFRDNRGKIVYLDPNQYSNVQMILDHLGINLSDVQILLVNGRHTHAQHELKENDIVALFPPVAGG
ncbi:MAG: molybdopterin synthase sulfur carrier subunit [Firmicutes bacterium HGW-Firmicutes-20]|jgi:molybdopterin converting factor small subunit|nr:MoaD/ThiS family protein [Erysipelotrichaceae bacterium]PKM64882.1 MAG: molybdopterin synthase sulfur carrier subunit [Firmicutes bacterium HGW-Firmicutes-20]PKM86413.1 MAG: molybdopterin synthase sulfur carrier subunit [Firmicutes bacterium HGW-Firmicutes-10]